MDSTFYIELTLKTVNGLESFAKFFVGNDRRKAFTIFQKLHGSDNANEKDVMYMSFMETKNDLPLNVDMITCTLNQLGENCKIITKELFKMHVLSV
jgi:hypothetical protein